MWPVQLALLCLLYVWHSFPPYSNTSSDFTQSTPSFSSTILQNFTGISDLSFEVSSFSTERGWLEILIISFAFHIHFQHITFFLCSVSLSIMPCSAISSLASSTRSSTYFTVQTPSPPILRSPNHSTTSLVRSSLCKLNRMDDKQHRFLTPLPVYTLLASPWSSCTEHSGLCTICWWISFAPVATCIL